MSKNNTLIENLYELAERLGGDDGAIVNEAIGLIECSISERDEARMEVCELSGNGSIDSAMRVAEERGWNLTEENT